jgi:hypothetical protein
MWNYIFPIGAALIALLQLAKDWGAHQRNWRRVAVLILIVLLGIGGAVNNYRTNKKSSFQRVEDQKEITGLKTAVETANKNQQDNTQVFVNALKGLSQKVSELQTQAATEKLQARLATVQAELRKTQKALEPGPKAELVFSFYPFNNSPIGTIPPAQPATDVTLPLHLNRTVHVEFTVLNMTSVDAVDVEITLKICDQCTFAKEPPGFTKLAGHAETERLQPIPRFLAQTELPTQSADVLVPPYIKTFSMGILYRCRTCIVPKTLSGGFVHIKGEASP